MKTTLKEKMNDEDVLVLNLKETIDNLQLLYQEVKRDADTRKDKYFTFKQKVKNFSNYKHPKYLQQIKQTTSFNEITFNKSKQVMRIEKPILKYIAEIDNFIIKQILSKQNNEQKVQQTSLYNKKVSQVHNQTEIDDVQQKPKLNKTKNHRIKTTPQNKDNQQQIVSKNEVDYPQNNQTMQQQTNQYQYQQLQASYESNIYSQQQNNFTEPDKNLIKQNASREGFHLPFLPGNYPQGDVGFKLLTFKF